MRIYKSRFTNNVLIVTNDAASFEIARPSDSMLDAAKLGLRHIIRHNAALYDRDTEIEATLAAAGYVIDPPTVPDDTVPQTATPDPGG